MIPSCMGWGTYTPTLTNVTNVAASTAYVCRYLRIGGTVIVSGRVDVDPTLITVATELGMTLPIASAFAATGDCAGTAVSPAVAGMSAAILADATNDRASIQWVAGDLSNRAMYFTFMYSIL